jgi:hypothetical protein
VRGKPLRTPANEKNSGSVKKTDTALLKFKACVISTLDHPSMTQFLLRKFLAELFMTAKYAITSQHLV